MRSPLEVLAEYWGYSSFREPQAAVISNALSGNDSLVVMATGGGKSICYQLPPLVSGRPCVVVSPLIALMEDQVAALTARGVKAAMLGSAQNKVEIKRQVWAGQFDLIYITPELAVGQIAELQQLHAKRPLGLIAIDEAHCLSEWGHDFRPDYRRLGILRESLPGVPIMAVTATATQRVQQDIIKQLHMNKAGSPPFRQWVMSFQRHNLHLAVQPKASGGPQANLAQLITEHLQGNSPGPTLTYAQTTNEVDTLAAHLQAKGVKAVKYHAKLPLSERVSAHRAFQRDDASVMVASLAFGMGIDKPNIRRIIHYGIPSSLESYYQQAGRAGRDGLPAECCLLWSPQDFVMQDMIKGATGLTGWNLESHTRGMVALRCYTSTGDCRHAALVNFFQPGTLNTQGPCEGGCDNCKRRQSVAPGAEAGTDITQPARLLIAAVKGLKNNFGLNRAVQVVKGSKSKQVESWMQELMGPDGAKLHGSGSNRSEEWWKGLGNVLMGQGLLSTKAKSASSGMNFSVTVVTPKGLQWLASAKPAPLCVMLPANMEDELNRQQRKEAAEAQRAADRQAAQQKRDEESTEKLQLLVALRTARKAKADELGQAPDVLVNDATLQLLIEMRPASMQDLSSVSGFGTAALQHFAQPLLQVIQDFCANSQHLKHNTDWVQVKRMRTAAQAGQQQHFQQHLQQFRMGTQPGPGMTQPGPGMSHNAPGQEGLQASQWFAARASSGGPAGRPVGGGPAAAAAAVSGAPWWQQGQQQQQHEQPVPVSVPLLTADPEVYQGLLDSKILAEPKKAAQSAWDQWELGRSVEQIATEGREKPIQESTVLGYLAEAAAAYGCSLQRAQQLQDSAGLAGDNGGSALLWRLVSAINGNKGCALSFLKSHLSADISYGQIKVAAALLALQVIPGAAGSSGGGQQQEQQLPLPAEVPQLGPELERLLQQPGSNAQELYELWQQGVPLEALGSMHSSGNMPMQTVLGYLADMAAAGYPTDMQQLTTAALLQQDSAQAIAAVLRNQGTQGVHAVRQALQQQLGDISPGQVKVVAALMATKSLWFAEKPSEAAAAEARKAAASGAAPEPEEPVAAVAATPAAVQEPAAAAAAAAPAAGDETVKSMQQVAGSSWCQVQAAAASAVASVPWPPAAAVRAPPAGTACDQPQNSRPACTSSAAGAAAVAAAGVPTVIAGQSKQSGAVQASGAAQAAGAGSGSGGVAAAAAAPGQGSDVAQPAAAAAADQDPPADGGAGDPESAAVAAVPPKRKLPAGLLLNNRTGKRRRPTAIAAPPAKPPAGAPPAKPPVTPQSATAAAAAGPAAAAAGAARSAGADGSSGQGGLGAAKTSSRLSGAALHSPLQLYKVTPPAAGDAQQQQQQQQLPAGGVTPSEKGAVGATGVPAWCTPAAKSAAGAMGPPQAVTPAATPAGSVQGVWPPAAAAAQGQQGGLVPAATGTPGPWAAAAAGMPAATPAAAAAGHQQGQSCSSSAAAAAPACITEQAVLQVLWQGRSSGPELMHKLGATTPQQAQQLQQVLEGLVQAGDQVLTTPACSKVDVRNAGIRFIAF